MERFLVVDDDENITNALTKILESMGFAVVAHTDPLEAAKETEFDLVLTDFMMPGLNGIELLAKLRHSRPEAVRLLLTAASDFKVAVDAVNRGEIFRLFAKPWQLSELRANINQAVDYYRLVQENKRLTRELGLRNAELTELNRTLESQVIERTNGALDGMVRALDFRDTETQWHSRRVSMYSRRIAEAYGLTGRDLDVIEQGALLHDVGKIGVRDAILLKPGPLTPEEWVEMKLHPEIGWRMLITIPWLREAAEIVYQHQERWDGRGYPRGLKAEEIVVGARVFCIADTLDAITSDRPYRKASPLQFAIDEIGRIGGTQLDPHIVKAFLSIPQQDWVDIRKKVEGMEADENRRWEGKTLNTAAREAQNRAPPPK